MKRLLTLAVLVIASLSLIACGEEATWSPESGVIRVGLEAAYAPFNWTTTTETEFTHPLANVPNAFVDGYDVQMARAIADALDVDLEIYMFAWTGLIPALRANQIDLIIAGMTATDARREIITFTDFYWESDIVMVVNQNGNFAQATTLAEFNVPAARIVAQISTIYVDIGINQIPNATHQDPLPNYAALISAVNVGTADGFIGEYPVAALAVAANANLMMIRFADGQGFDPAYAPVSIGLRQSDHDFLRVRINEALAQISIETRYGWMDAAIARHYATPDTE